MQLPRFSMGVGDRFGKEGVAQLRAFQKARDRGMSVLPVWNKSNREHGLTGTQPSDTRDSAQEAVRAAGWQGGFLVDADHIGLQNVEPYLQSCDFFTLDVADRIGKAPPAEDQRRLCEALRPWADRPWPELGVSSAPGGKRLEKVVEEYGSAVLEAGKIYRKILEVRPPQSFITEVSTDEANHPQSPWVLFLLLGALSKEGVPVQTVAPKFSGQFHKGVDYLGDPERFRVEFLQDLEAVRIAIQEFGLPKDLKISIHSGSDKFSLYPVIRDVISQKQAGFHLKTAGTTWLEELIGLAMHGGEGLRIVKEIYSQAYQRQKELIQPYATVVAVEGGDLPEPSLVQGWTGDQFVSALQHKPSHPGFCPSLRQLLHIAFKIAAEMQKPFFEALDAARDVVEENVTQNLWERHLRPLGGL